MCRETPKLSPATLDRGHYPAIRGNIRQSGGEEAENISGLRTTSVTGEVIAQPQEFRIIFNPPNPEDSQ
jgi:hypothetical protein